MAFAHKLSIVCRVLVRETNPDSGLVPAVLVQIDPAELHFLILHYLAAGPCRGALRTLELEALTNSLLPCRHDIFGVSLLTLHDHMSGIRAHRYPTTRPCVAGDERKLSYVDLQQKYAHIAPDTLPKLLQHALTAQRLRTGLNLEGDRSLLVSGAIHMLVTT